LGGLGAAAAEEVWGDSNSGGGVLGFAPCYPFGPCIGNGIRVGDYEMGAMAQICYPGGFRTVPCLKGPYTTVSSVGKRHL
jgi:hypothetical protein